jgi:predicted nucleotidyltransferase
MSINENNELLSKLQKCSERLAVDMPIRKVILFGSYVWGDINKESDIDLLVIGERKDRNIRTEIAMEFHHAIPDKPMDVLLKTNNEINDRVIMGDSFIRKIITEGKILYGKDEGDRERVAG